MNGLGNDARAVLARHREALDDAELGAAHNWAMLVRRIERGEPPLDIDDAPPAASRRNVAARWSVAAALVLAFGGAAYLSARNEIADRRPDERHTGAAAYGADDGEHASLLADDEAPRRAGKTARKPPSAPQAAPAATPAIPPQAPASTEPRDSAKLARPHARPATRAQARDDAATSANAEAMADVRLLARARAALRDGKPQAALDLLRGHARRSPNSQLAPERDMLVVAALCDANRSADARAAASAFRRNHPTAHHLLAHVARACDGR